MLDYAFFFLLKFVYVSSSDNSDATNKTWPQRSSQVKSSFIQTTFDTNAKGFTGS